MRAFLAGITLLFFSSILQAQIFDPVSWSTEVNTSGEGSFQLLIHAKIEKGWHLYAQDLPADDGPIATEFSFEQDARYNLKGDVVEPEPITEYDPNFDMDLNYFEEEVTFKQVVISNSEEPYEIRGEAYFMVCNKERCLPPEAIELVFQIPAFVGTGSNQVTNSKSVQLLETQKEKSENTEKTVGSLDGSIKDPVKWSFSSKQIDSNHYELLLDARIDEGWHLYAQELPSDNGPIATAFYFNEEGHEFIGDVEEDGEMITDFDPNFEMDLNYYSNEVLFIQKIKTSGNLVKGELEFMVCNEMMCLPPEVIEFEFDLGQGLGVNSLEKNEEARKGTEITSIIPSLPNVDVEKPLGNCGEQRNISNVWMVFILGFLGGLIALLTPCVFPMIPLTVSFFTKGDGGAKGIGKAVLYGFFIFFIYAVLSIPFHFNTDPEILNEVATSVWLNLIFFIIFVVFAISFFGFFEITLPSSLTNKADSASQVGGVIGIFFMALTLALVSFSCTASNIRDSARQCVKEWTMAHYCSYEWVWCGIRLAFCHFCCFSWNDE